VDAIIEVVRCFEDKDIVHVAGSVDPARDIEIVKTELILKDLDALAKHKTRFEKSSRTGLDKKAQMLMALLGRFEKAFNEGRPARTVERTAEEAEAMREVRFLTDKPFLYVANISEDEISKPDSPHTASVRRMAEAEGSGMIKLSGRIEEEISRLEPVERQEYLTAMGMEESGLDQLARAGHALLKLQTFFTVGETENRAWTVEAGATAPRAAGKIHSDFERGFIRAEVIAYGDFIQYRGEQGAREKGRLRLEGKEYIVQDGDIMHFRFSV
jgi:GTP-binding protein YchF